MIEFAKNARGVSETEIESAKTSNGGWTREQLAEWGVSWPPPKGWKRELIKKHEDSTNGQ